MKTLMISSKLLKTLVLAGLLAPFACAAAEDEPEPVWQDAVIVRQGEREYELLTAEEADERDKAQREAKASADRKPAPG